MAVSPEITSGLTATFPVFFKTISPSLNVNHKHLE